MPVNDNDFDLMQEEAIRQAREMFRRSSPAVPDPEPEESSDAVPMPESSSAHAKQGSGRAEQSFLSANNTPLNILNGIVRDKDTIILLALILLLFSDSADKLLILALIYIMS